MSDALTQSAIANYTESTAIQITGKWFLEHTVEVRTLPLALRQQLPVDQQLSPHRQHHCESVLGDSDARPVTKVCYRYSRVPAGRYVNAFITSRRQGDQAKLR